MKTLLDKIKEAKLVGRGGAEFPTAVKWESTKKAKGSPKYVICNASEGEPGVYKDLYILQNFPEEVVKGMVLAMDFLKTDICYFNLNGNYYKKVIKKLNPLIKKYEKKGYKFEIYKEDPSYIGGEESAILNAIEGKRTEPRIKPPFPVEVGLHGKPTLIHNVETLFNIAKVSEGKYKPFRFYTVCGKVKNPGVYFLQEHLTAEKLLEMTGNTPKFDYFGQIGGGASGMVVSMEQAKSSPVNGAGSLEIYPLNTDPHKMLLKWFKFYAEQSCGKCTPCREGSYQLYELVKNNDKNIPWEQINEIVDAMGKTSFCALGKSIMIPVHSYRMNVLNHKS
jgi:NADH:ubiquinone oxidoreductase subunit F (NADH-binding)